MDILSRHIRLDFRSQEPIYLQIVRQVEKLVQDGALKPGDQLPTVRQMAIDLRINFSTVARAYNILDERRLISTQRGRGTYIWNDRDLPGDEVKPQPFDGSDADPAQPVERLVEGWFDQAARQGFTLEEIQRAFIREIARRKNDEDKNRSLG